MSNPDLALSLKNATFIVLLLQVLFIVALFAFVLDIHLGVHELMNRPFSIEDARYFRLIEFVYDFAGSCTFTSLIFLALFTMAVISPARDEKTNTIVAVPEWYFFGPIFAAACIQLAFLLYVASKREAISKRTNIGA